MLEEECSLVEEVVPERREVEMQECRLKEQECSSVEREQFWPGPVEREVFLIKWLLSTVQEKKCLSYQGQTLYLLGWEVSLLIWTDTTSPRMGSVLANRAGYYILLGWEVSLLIWQDTIFTWMGSVLAKRPDTALPRMGSVLANRA